MEAGRRVDAGGAVEEMESRRTGLHVLGAAAWMQRGLNQSCV